MNWPSVVIYARRHRFTCDGGFSSLRAPRAISLSKQLLSSDIANAPIVRLELSAKEKVRNSLDMKLNAMIAVPI